MKSTLIIPLDYSDAGQALALARLLQVQRPWMKVGLELLMHAGPQIVSELREMGFFVFLDGKFHDIPNTVAGAVRGAVATGANIINVHASGGVRMMRAARESAEQAAAALGVPRPLVIGVTVLTSLSSEELQEEVGCSRPAGEQALSLALCAKEAGLDGVVASPQEIETIKAACGASFVVITPGIRPVGSGEDDQRRIATPRAAVQAGADFLVVGRPITQAPDPAAACAAVMAEMDV